MGHTPQPAMSYLSCRFHAPHPIVSRRSRLCCGVLSVCWIFVAGCSREQFDPQAAFDSEVEAGYLQKFPQAEAVRFLTEGGLYVDSGDPDDPEVARLDQAHVVPLLQRLDSEFSMKSIAVLSQDDPQVALAIVAALPDGVTKEEVTSLLMDVQQEFPGEILVEWGHKWLSLDFLTAQDVADLDGL